MKAHMHSWVDAYEDEEGRHWDGHLHIMLPDGQGIDFEVGLPSEAEANKWCTDFEALLVKCTVTLSENEQKNNFNPWRGTLLENKDIIAGNWTPPVHLEQLD